MDKLQLAEADPTTTLETTLLPLHYYYAALQLLTEKELRTNTSAQNPTVSFWISPLDCSCASVLGSDSMHPWSGPGIMPA